MADNDCGLVMKKFHSQEVNLSNDQQSKMRERRDAGRTRLKNGLDSNQLSQPKLIHSQGSYQMRTMVQDLHNEYDIDDGVYFYKDDLVDSSGLELTPLQARERVCDALSKDQRLREKAVIKNNCVRQEYPEGYHIDMPVYRIQLDVDSNEYYELSSGNLWVESDARAVTKWFNDAVGIELASGQEDTSQLRRITKLSKKFSRREDWKSGAASGICITKLVVDHFVPAVGRDDVAIRETWQAISNALAESKVVQHPVLTDNNIADEYDEKVTYFKDCLDWALTELRVLDNPDCSEEDAHEAWDKVFDTTFFTERLQETKSKQSIIIQTSDRAAQRQDNGRRFG